MLRLPTESILGSRKEKIMAEWIEKSLGEIAEITKLAGFEFTKYIEYNNDGEVIALRALNLRNGELDLTDIKRISRKVSDGLTRSKIYKDDILLTYTGNGYGDCAIIEENDKYHLAPNICKIVPNKNVVFPYYLYCYIRSKAFYNQMSNNMTGSGQPTIPMKTIRLLKIPVPEMRVQVNIANMLWLLNQKIRNNKVINNNLEQQAQALYQQTFITNYDPNWKKGVLSNLVTVRYGKDHKKLEDGIYPVYGSGGIMRYVEKPLYTGESVLIPRKGTLNNVMYVDGAFWSVDTMFYTEMLYSNVAKFVYHFVKSKDLASMNAGSAVPSMTTNILNAMQLYIPDNETLSTFEKIVSPMYSQMQENEEQSKKLADIRDTLLPRLMSGEIDVLGIEF